MKKIVIACLLLVLAGTVLLAGCTQPAIPPPTPTPTTVAQTTPAPTPAPDTIRVTSNAKYGQILTDSAGRTLYYFARDTPKTGTSACYGTCASTWPPFYADTIRVSPPLAAGDFGQITAVRQQTTYKGWPLYYYSGDMNPGDTRGYGILSIWYVMAPTGVVTLAPTTTVPTTPPYSSGGGY